MRTATHRLISAALVAALTIALSAACGRSTAMDSYDSARTSPPGGGADGIPTSPDNDPTPLPPPTPTPPDTPAPPIITPVDPGPEPHQFLDVNEVASLLDEWASLSPQLMSTQTVATIDGSPSKALRIASPKARHNALIFAGVHGDEKIGVAVALGVAHRLIAGYARDDRVTRLLDATAVTIVPVTCPDGYAADSRTVDGGRDPNRTFPSPGAESVKSARCITALREFADRTPWRATMDVHASGRMVLLPWAYTSTPFADNGREVGYRRLGQKMGGLSGYQWGSVPSMVGYLAPGSSMDYFYVEGKRKNIPTCAMGLEVGTSKRPSESAIVTEIDKNWPMMQTFIEEAPTLFDTTYSGDLVADLIPLPHYPTFPEGFVMGEE